jgi:hypothetical protein
MRSNFHIDVLLHRLRYGYVQGARLPGVKPFTQEERHALIKHLSTHRQSLLTLAEDNNGKASNAIQMDGCATKARNAAEGSRLRPQIVRMASG